MLPRKAALRRRFARPAARSLIARCSLALAAAALLVAGCGGDDEGGGGDGDAASELTIVLDPDGPGGEPQRSAEVTCDGEQPACPELQRLTPADVAAVPPETPCTQIYGGPDVVKVSGTIDGEPVEAELTRIDGCQIQRFDRFMPLLRELFPGYRPGAALVP